MQVIDIIKTHYINFKDGPRPSDRLLTCKCSSMNGRTIFHPKSNCAACDRALEGQDLQEAFDNSLRTALVYHQPKDSK